jgi:RNA polymerase-binding transcription factor DksA
MPSKKKTPAKKATKKTATKTAPSKKASAKKTPAKKKSVAPTTAPETKTPEALKKAVVSRVGAAADKKSTPIIFSLDDIEQLMAAKKSVNKSEAPKVEPEPVETKPKVQPAKKVVVDDQPIEKRVLGAASLADILGFNPAEKKKTTELDEDEVPKKWTKYYNLLIELRAHVSDEISLHTADTLKHSSRDDSGESAYGNHDSDADSDTFDRDFALSLVSSEQDALNEIEQAILRIKDGSYGVCEITAKPIPAARLTAVPFARYSVEGQVEHEKNRHRKNNRAVAGGIFGDVSDTPKLESDDDDE